MTRVHSYRVAEGGRRAGFLEMLLLVLGVLSFIRFDYLNMMGLSRALNMLQLAVLAFSTLCLLTRRARIEWYHFTWLLICLWILAVTCLAGADMTAATRFVLKIATPAVYFTAFRDDFPIILRILYVVLSVLAVANLITILLFPDGMYVTGVTNFACENWLLGFKNKHLVFYLPLMLATFCLIELDGLSWDKVAVLGAMVVASFLAGSGTAIICMGLIVLFAFIPVLRQHYRLFNAWTYLLAGATLFLLVVVLRAQNVLASVIVGLLGKDMTFSNRTAVWDAAIQQISRSPVTGLGYLTVSQRHQIYNSHSIMSAHDQILEYAFVGGAILVTLFLIANLQLARRLGDVAARPVIQLSSVVYLAMLVAMLVEVYEDPLFYALYFMLWNVPDLTPSGGRTRRERKDGELWDAKLSLAS